MFAVKLGNPRKNNVAKTREHSARDWAHLLGLMILGDLAIDERSQIRSLPSERIGNHRRLAYFRTHYAHLPIGDRLIRTSGLERLHVLFNSVNQYQFHWGFERTRNSYRSVAKPL